MEKKWKICEIEDGTKYFIEYSVAAIPINWIFELEDGTIWCYWPRKNVLKKIKSCEPPNQSWPTYQCRILMNEGIKTNFLVERLGFLKSFNHSNF